MRTLAILLLSALACAGQAFTLSDPAFLSQQYAASASPPAGNTLTNNIAAYYKLEDTNWLDSGPLGLFLTNSAAVYNTNGVAANGAYFSAAANFLGQTRTNSFSALANSLTISAWMRTTSTNGLRDILSKDTASTGNREYVLQWSGSAGTPNAFQWRVFTNAAGSVYAYTQTNGIAAGTWYFVCAQIDTTNYQCRVRYGTTSALWPWSTSAALPGWGPTGAGTNTTARFMLGIESGGSGLSGALDEVGVWDRLLTDTEVTNIWTTNSLGQSLY